eukprot:8238632-Alexandrium_andersonii.AAC.1
MNRCHLTDLLVRIRTLRGHLPTGAETCHQNPLVGHMSTEERRLVRSCQYERDSDENISKCSRILKII